MIMFILSLGLMAGGAAALAQALPWPNSILWWLALAVGLCVLGAGALMMQPIGRVTALGRFGGLFVRWGFRAGRGRLLPAILISWMVWAIIGSAVITAVVHRDEPQVVMMVAAWAVDTLALMRVIGVPLAQRSRRMAQSLLPVGGALLGMLVGSAVLWNAGSRAAAILLAAGPPLVIAGGYGLFMAVVIFSGKKARWH